MAKASIRGAMDMELGGEGRRHKKGKAKYVGR
jgi:hypothetical protein